jgi:hypothetical protein
MTILVPEKIEQESESRSYFGIKEDSVVEFKPLLANVDLRRFAILASLMIIAISSWFYTAGAVKITEIPPDAFFYIEELPIAYWIGLGSTLSLIVARRFAQNNVRTLLDISTLFLLSAYLFAIPSFTYQDPRFLDPYYHEGNALAMLVSGGWTNVGNTTIWYLKQWPGAYSFFAELTAVAGIQPLQLIQYYPAGITLVWAFMIYSIMRTYSPNYSTLCAAFVLSCLWFETHLSPQSLDLVLYLGFLYLLIKIIDDRSRRKLWTGLAIACAPMFVFSHPETSLHTDLGLFAGLILTFLFAKQRIVKFRSKIRLIGPLVIGLSLVIVLWWSTIGHPTFDSMISIFNASLTDLGSHHGPHIPSTPAFSYAVTNYLEEGVSVLVWVLGLSLLLFIRRFRAREFLFAGLIVEAISTIPVAIGGYIDVLQRSFLFALFPLGFLLASLLQNPYAIFSDRNILRFKRNVWFSRPLSKILVMIIVALALLMPITFYGLDSFAYPPQSTLLASDVTASLSSNHSVLFVDNLVSNPATYFAWRFYTPFYGNYTQYFAETNNMSTLSGGFIQYGNPGQAGIELLNNGYSVGFNNATGTANYLYMMDPLFNNLYILKFGSNSTFYLNIKNAFENQTIQTFNLVYSTGTDRIYENTNLG